MATIHGMLIDNEQNPKSIRTINIEGKWAICIESSQTFNPVQISWGFVLSDTFNYRDDGFMAVTISLNHADLELFPEYKNRVRYQDGKYYQIMYIDKLLNILPRGDDRYIKDIDFIDKNKDKVSLCFIFQCFDPSSDAYDSQLVFGEVLLGSLSEKYIYQSKF